VATISHPDLCTKLKVTRARVDSWLARGLLKLETETVHGRVRRWTERDAIKLAALRDVADANLPLEQVAPHIQLLTRRNDDAYLTIYYGPHRLIPSSSRGDSVPNETELSGPEVTVPGHLVSEIFRGEGLLKFLSDGRARVAIVLPLHLITARVDQIFSEV
jgi:MerR HTH family regulatory protein